MDRVLMVVAAEHEIDLHVRERAEHARRVLQPVTLRQLSLHRVVMHHDDANVRRR